MKQPLFVLIMGNESYLRFYKHTHQWTESLFLHSSSNSHFHKFNSFKVYKYIYIYIYQKFNYMVFKHVQTYFKLGL